MMMTTMITVMQIAITPPTTPPMIGPMDWFPVGEVMVLEVGREFDVLVNGIVDFVPMLLQSVPV
jgi:hypothetical protein